MADQTKNVNLNLKTSADTRGIDEVSKKVSALQDGVTSALLTLITTGSKMQAVFDGVKSAIITKVLGPLGQFAGLSVGVLSSIKRLSAEFGTMGASAAGAIEMLEQQFRPLLKSMEAAKNRMAELRKFAKETPFGLNQVAEANKILENFTKGALSTAKGMTMVGDAAAVAGQELASVSMWVGRLYDGLQSGRPIGEAAFRLQEMGIFTGQARNAIEDMQASGASFSQMWRVVEMELGRAAGGMEYTSKTLVSLKQQLEDTKDAMMSGFGEGFLSGEKAGIEAQIKAIELIRPAMEEWGTYLGKGREVINNFKKAVVDTASSVPLLQSAVSVAGSAFSAFNAIISGIAGVGVFKMIYGIAKAGSEARKAGTLMDMAKKSVAGFGDAATSVKKMDIATAGATVKMAALNMATSAAGATMKGLGGVAKWFVGGLVHPLSLLVAGFAVVTATIVHYIYKLNETRKAHEAYQRGTKEMIDSMAAFRQAIGTTQQLVEAYTRNMMALSDAYRDLGKARADDNAKAVKASQERINELNKERDSLGKVKQTSLQRPQEMVERDLAENEKRVARRDQDRMDAIIRDGGPDMDAKIEAELKRRIDEQAKAEGDIRRSSAISEATRISSAAMENDRAGKAGSIASDISYREARIAILKRQQEAAYANAAKSELNTLPDTTKSDAEIAALTEEIKRLNEAMNNIGTPELDQVEAAMRSGDPLAISKSKIGLISAYEQAAAAKNQVKLDLDGLPADSSDPAVIARRESKLKEEQAINSLLPRLESAIIKIFGSVGAMALAKQNESRDSRLIEQERTILADPNRAKDSEAQLKDQYKKKSQSAEEARIDALERRLSLTDNLVQAELDAIMIAKQRIDLEVQHGQVSAEVANSRKAALDDEIRNIQFMAERRKEMIRDESELAGMELDASNARGSGDVGTARTIEERAARKRAEMADREEFTRVYGETGDSKAADEAAKKASERILKEQAAKAKQESEQMQRNAEQRNASLKASELERQATIAAANGQNDRAAALREAAKRAEEEASNGQRVIETMQQYGVSREEAIKMVDQEIEAARKQREVEEQIRKRDQERAKENTRDEEDAADAEAKGNTRRAARIRRKARERNRTRELMDEGFSEDEASEIAGKEGKREKRKEWSDRYQAAAEAFFKFVESLKEMMQKIRDFNEDLKVKKLRAEGRDEEADKLAAQIEFENRVKQLQSELGVDPKTAEKMAQEEEKVNNALRQREIQNKINQLNEELAYEKTEGLRKAQAESNATRRINAVNAVRTDMTSIGGSVLAQGGVDRATSDTTAIKENVKRIEEILQQIREAQNERFVVHSVRPKDDPKVGLIVPGKNGPNKIYV